MIFYKMKWCAIHLKSRAAQTIPLHRIKGEKDVMVENQTAYEHEEEIDLVALCFTLLHKYRQLLAAALACAVIFGAAAGIRTARSGSVSEEAEEDYAAAMTEYLEKKESYEAAKDQYDADIEANEKSQSAVVQAIQNAQKYAEDSVLNNLNPYNVWTARADLYVSTGYQIQPGMSYQNPDHTTSVLSAYASALGGGKTVQQDELGFVPVSGTSVPLKEIAQKLSVEERYLQELVTVETDPDASLLRVTVLGRDEQMAADILDAVLEYVETLRPAITESVGEHTIATIAKNSSCTVSLELRDIQNSNAATLVNLQSQINTLQQNRTKLDDNFTAATETWDETSKPVLPAAHVSSSVGKYGVLGLLLGIVLVCGVGTLQFLMQGKVYSGRELNQTTGLPLLGTLASERTKKAGKLDAALNKMEGRPDGSGDEEMIRLMAVTVRSRAPEADSILVTGDLPAEQLNALAIALQNTDALRAQTVKAAGSILQNAATVPQVTDTDAIVLAADCTCSRYADVKDQTERIRRLGKNILGCIVFE